MDELAIEQKKQSFNEFFTIKHTLNVNVIPLAQDAVLPAVDQLENEMPYAFAIASELSSIETQALRPLRSLGEHAQELAQFLNLQSRKIDLMMSLILQQQDDPETRTESIAFGGGGITLFSEQAMPIGQSAELKIFLKEEAAAVFCFGEVIECEAIESQAVEAGHHVSLVFTRIREEDQDLLVKASLHLQSQQLKKRHKKNP